MRILGLDIDTKFVGMFLLSDRPEWNTLQLTGDDFNQRLCDVVGAMGLWRGVDLVCIERPYFSHNVATYGQLCQIHGGVKAVFLARNVRVLEPSYSETLSVVGLPTSLGRAKLKGEVLRLVRLEYPVRTEHEADAYLAARWAFANSERR